MKKQTICGGVVAAAVAIAIGCAAPQMHRQMDASYESYKRSSPAASSPQVMMHFASGGMEGRSVSANVPSLGAASPEHAAKLTLASMSDSQADRYLIKNDVITIEAPDVHKAAGQAREAAISVNGYVSNSHEIVDNLGLCNITLEVRIPSSEFDASMSRVETIGRVLDNQVTSEDVTEQFVDTTAQLRNLKETEARLLDHLKQTGKLGDILLVETELNRVRASADELEGKVRFMSHRITYSTINMTFKEPAHIEPISPPESFSVLHIASEAMRSFTGFLQSVIAIGIWVLIWSVLWAPILVGATYAYVKLRPRR